MQKKEYQETSVAGHSWKMVITFSMSIVTQSVLSYVVVRTNSIAI